MSAMLHEEYVSVAEAATLLSVGQSTICRWIDAGNLPAYRFGQRRVRLKRSDLDALITPARQGREQRARMARIEQHTLGPLTRKEQQQGLAAIEAAKKLRAEMLSRRGGKLFESSHSELDELREQRTRDLE